MLGYMLVFIKYTSSKNVFAGCQQEVCMCIPATSLQNGGWKWHFIDYPKYPDPSKVPIFENPDPCYTGSNPSIGGSKDPWSTRINIL